MARRRRLRLPGHVRCCGGSTLRLWEAWPDTRARNSRTGPPTEQPFGWDEPDGSCDVRDDALLRDGRGVEVDEDCSITAGKWIDPYTGTTLTDSGDVDIDHIVPLANAWRSGANDWDESRREAYANDPGVLLSVDDAANQTKGDKGPEAWLPPNTAYRCEYGRRWIWIKHKWNLTVNAQERTTLQELLQGCKSR